MTSVTAPILDRRNYTVIIIICFKNNRMWNGRAEWERFNIEQAHFNVNYV